MKSKRRIYLSREAYINYVTNSKYIYAYIYIFNDRNTVEIHMQLYTPYKNFYEVIYSANDYGAKFDNVEYSTGYTGDFIRFGMLIEEFICTPHIDIIEDTDKDTVSLIIPFYKNISIRIYRCI